MIGLGGWRARLRDGMSRALVFLNFCCFMDVFTNHVLQIQQCLGPSMLPTFNVAGDILAVEHLSTRFKTIKVGDVVMARSPINPRMVLCKRVLGLEGDRITFQDSNGRFKPVLIPKGHMWLQGDNLEKSRDSRMYGPVPYALLEGRVFYRIWPPQGWGPIPRS